MRLSKRRKDKSISYMSLPGLKNGYRFPPSESVSGTLIEEMVSRFYGVSLEDMFGRKRDREFVTARHVCMWLMRKYTLNSFKKIAGVFNRDHTTAIHSIANVNNLMETDPIFREEVRTFEKRLQ